MDEYIAHITRQIENIDGSIKQFEEFTAQAKAERDILCRMRDHLSVPVRLPTPETPPAPSIELPSNSRWDEANQVWLLPDGSTFAPRRW